MKKSRKTAVLLAALLSVSLCACGPVEEAADSVSVTKDTTTTTEAVSDTPDSVEESSQTDMTEEKIAVLDSFSEDHEAFVSIMVSGKTSGEIFLREFSTHVLHNGVVGKVGVPFEATFDNIENGKMTVAVDPDHINGVPLRNLLLLYYNEEDDNYEEIWCEADEKTNSVSAGITKSGVYVLADWYQWGGAWGVDVSDYAYAHDSVQYGNVVGERTKLPYSVTIPYTYKGFDHEEEYPQDKYEFDVFYRISGQVEEYGNVDIAYVTPKETLQAEDFYELMKTSLTKDFDWWEEIKSQESVTSADGTEGVKFVVSHKYVSGDDTYTLDDNVVFFPDGSGNYFCLIFNYSDKYANTYEKILSSFTIER